jgi:predicted NBD/HSP70 family sugar kinase
MTRDTTVKVLRRANRAAVLRYLVIAGETTRAQVGQHCNLSVGSVTNVVNDLISEGLVQESGVVPSTGGRPTTLLSPRPEGAYFIGADVGELGVAVELFDLRLRPVDREFARPPTDDQPDADAIGRALGEAVSRLWDRNPEKWTGVAGIGMALPGVVETDAEGVQTLYAQSLGWAPTPVRDLLDVPAVADLPIYADNGAKTLAAAESALGRARGASRALVALLGRGVGLGVLSGGEIVRGSVSSAAEWGHTRVTLGGRPCRCGGHGCVEAYIGADAILARWREAGGVVDGQGWNALGALLDAAQDGDQAARHVVDESIEILGIALANLINLYNPERVVIGGWVGLRLMERHASQIERAVSDTALARFANQFTLDACAFGGDSVALGAALLPLDRLIDAPDTSPLYAPILRADTPHPRGPALASKEMS